MDEIDTNYHICDRCRGVGRVGDAYGDYKCQDCNGTGYDDSLESPEDNEKPTNIGDNLFCELDEAERKAWESLARYPGHIESGADCRYVTINTPKLVDMDMT